MAGLAAYSAPDFIVHYSRGEPFRTITSLSDSKLEDALAAQNPDNTWGISRFADRQYLKQRRELEERLRSRFVALGGRPILQNPVYFFLGRNPRFEEDPRNVGYVISLKDVSSHSVSFCYGDSMFAFLEENRPHGGDKYQNPLCGELYSLAGLPLILTHPAFPTAKPLSIEAQLWELPDPTVVKKLQI